jgi:hypothetical protein
MSDLLRISGIGKATSELLEAAGFLDATSVARAGVDELLRELERANSILKISKRLPGRVVVGKWIDSARELTVGQAAATGEGPAPMVMPVNYEASPQVADMLASAPFAIPLPARLLVENQLAVSDIPAAILLNRYSGDLDVRVEERLPRQRQPKAAAGIGNFVKVSDPVNARVELDTSKFRTMDEIGEALPRMAAPKTTPASDRVALLRAPRTSTNKGRDPKSRFYIRGVLHSHPLSIMVGAVVTLLLMVMIPLSVVSAGLLLLSAEVPGRFSWVPGWLLVIPVLLPLFGIAYLIWGTTGSCRICGQKLFSKRAHLKNPRAHHVPGLGYIVPLCFHILAFRWFRCTHCGTPVRLKE